ncbi:MAG: cell division protein ZapD [Proteobacteria bacterium]|nr:cell division protein ZapD [Pseudomonadota bacterium]
MYDDDIIFQLPTHFLPKISLRLEHLYQTIDKACEEHHPIIHHYALKNLLDMLVLIEKPELKSRFLKEFMHIEHSAKLKNKPQMAEALHKQIHDLTKMVGRFGNDIHANPFLQSVRQNQPTVGNECEPTLPNLILWLEANPALRQHELACWLHKLRFLYDTVFLYLSIIRESAEFHKIQLNNGFYQASLPPKSTCHLIMLKINKNAGIAPHMQLGHHGLSLRLSDAKTLKEIHDDNINLALAICQL